MSPNKDPFFKKQENKLRNYNYITGSNDEYVHDGIVNLYVLFSVLSGHIVKLCLIFFTCLNDSKINSQTCRCLMYFKLKLA